MQYKKLDKHILYEKLVQAPDPVRLARRAGNPLQDRSKKNSPREAFAPRAASIAKTADHLICRIKVE